MSTYNDIDQLIIDTVEELRAESSDVTDTNIEVNLPTLVTFKCTRKMSYGDIHRVFQNKFSLQENTLLLSFDIPFTSKFYKRDYMDSLDNLVSKKAVYPFLFFVNGEFIKWSDIFIIKECRYSYILIKGKYVLEDNYKMILLPKNVKYNETGHISDKTLFAFKDGKLYRDETDINENCISIDNDGFDNMYYRELILENNMIQLFDLNPKYEMSSNNILIFKDDLFYGLPDEYHGLNMFSVNGNILDSAVYRAKGFYYYKANTKLDNTQIIMKYNMIQSKSVTNNKVESYYELFKDRFKMEKFSFKKSYLQNISTALNYVMEYNSGLMNRYYDKINKTVSRVYTGLQLKKLVNSEGNIKMSRRIRERNDNYVIIFVNGELYSNYYDLKYINKDFIFPFVNIEDEDIVELLFFLEVDNRDFSFVMSSRREDTYFIDDSINKDHLKLFTQQPYALDFHIEVSPHKQYDVDFDYEINEDGTTSIYPKHGFYYDKRLQMASERQFRYYRFISPYEIIDLPLPTDEFKYCTNPDQYMVFINNRKIPSTNFEIITPQADTPFDDYSIYFNIPLDEGDIMEIFYLPDVLDELYENVNMSLDPSGNIYLDKTKLKHNIDKNLDFIFVNGKKVPSDSIYEVSQKLVKITTNIRSLENLSIIQHTEYSDLLYKLFASTEDKITEIISSLTKEEYSNMFDDTLITDEERDITAKQIPMENVAYSIMKDYYCAPFVNLGENFAFANPDGFFTEKDPEGTLMLDHFNGERENKPLRGRDDGNYEEIHR